MPKSASPGAIQPKTVQQKMPKDDLDRFHAAASSARLGLPEDIAVMGEFQLSDDAGWINGQTMSVNGGSMMC